MRDLTMRWSLAAVQLRAHGAALVSAAALLAACSGGERGVTPPENDHDHDLSTTSPEHVDIGEADSAPAFAAGDLVISELMDVSPPPSEAVWEYGMYFEVYNNTSQSLYLDGRVFGAAYQYGTHETDHTPCSRSEPARSDPTGLYSRHMIAFPGTGTDHPIAPGEAKVVAISATDHTEVHPMLVDLTDADFEIGTAAAANNPAVPDMRDIGLESFVLEPFGSPLSAIGDVFFLAESLDPQSMPIEFRDPQGRGYVRVPESSIIEAVSFTVVVPDANQEHPPCIPLIHETFDRYEDATRGVELHDYSFVRRVLRTTGGRAVLQNTNTTAVDFIHGEYSPGSVP